MLVPSLAPTGPSAGPVLVVAVRGSDVALLEPAEWGGDDHGAALFVGSVAGRHCWAVDADDRPADAAGTGEFHNLMRLYGEVEEPVWAAAGRAVQLVEWNRNHRYCGRCGTPTEMAPTERARRCPACGLHAFPRLAPAIITLVQRDDGRVLLARNARWPGDMYSCLAGFVEPGESVEDAVRREVLEEVGVEVGELRYFGSQPWPFPHSLMLGFHARYRGGDIEVDGEEIAEARWFAPEDLPQIPGRISIARKLIDDWLATG
ncbi:MAG TPA: NAD(+) diphosphatase [Acidimicrobiales bacterium]|nr:NAD(+) diphosphatase [Acidimicrobiales bacterium]